MTDECYHRFVYDDEPYSIASIEGREGHGAGGRVAFEDLRDDRMAHRLRSRTGSGDVVGQQAAEPQHVESDLDRAEGCGRGAFADRKIRSA